MSVKRLVYAGGFRLPTEKAHGYQVCKMCEAFARNGAETYLLHPYRYQFDPALRDQCVFDYYGIAPVFQVRSLPNLDIIPIKRYIPDRFFMPILIAHSLIWGIYTAQVARRYKADLYYTRDPIMAYGMARLGLPTAFEAHTVPKGGKRWFMSRIAKNPALKLAVGITSFITERLVRLGFPPEKAMTLPDGVDMALFQDVPDRLECRKRYGLPTDRPIIGYVGRFRTMEAEKGLPELIRAMASVPLVDGSEPLLVCIGGPMDAVAGYLEIARHYSIPERRLKFLDRVPNKEIPFWIRAFDIAAAPFPFTDHYAYFMSPLKLFEYMAAGATIIATDLPSIREVIRHDHNGWLVEPDHPEDLAIGLTCLLHDPALRSRLGTQAGQDVVKYTWIERAHRIVTCEHIL
ncbi:MAG: glycosyltransferase family 4 protein [Armatimonadetes bacterium]|nr:glycosyltransferase family 4 protein [Armatimonadota bacterium]